MTRVLPDHFQLGPSSASRWIKCPGSAKEPYDDETSYAAERGTLGHSMVECRLKGHNRISQKDRQFFDAMEPDEQALLRRHVEQCVEFMDDMRKSGGYTRFAYETKIADEIIAEHGGTVDVIAVAPGILHVVDFKFGFVNVEAKDNWQLKCYINLARQWCGDRRDMVYFGTIIQPATGEPETVEFSEAELFEARKAVLAASISNERYAGEHCEWCPLTATCTTLAKHVIEECQEFPNLTQLATEIEDDAPTPEQVDLLARMYRAGKLAGKMTDGASVLLKRYAMKGHDAGGLVNRTQVMAWAADDPCTALATIAHTAGLDATHKPAKPLTPTEVCKALAMTKAEFAEKFGDFVKMVPRFMMGRVNEKDGFPEFDDLT